MDGEAVAQGKLQAAGRLSASIFAACCAERLRPLLEHVPPGATPLVAGVALTELWRVLEGLQRADPRRLQELSKACWALVEIEPIPKVRGEHLEALVGATHDALEAYLTGNARHALAAAKKVAPISGEREPARQERDLADITAAREAPAQLATRLRERAEAEGEALVRELIAP